MQSRWFQKHWKVLTHLNSSPYSCVTVPETPALITPLKSFQGYNILLSEVGLSQEREHIREQAKVEIDFLWWLNRD